MNYPESFKYTKDHEWVRIDGDVGTIGVTHHAQQALGDVVFVELPAVGTKVQRAEQFGTIESVKAVSELYAPVSGEVVEVNGKLEDNPAIVNADPHDAGWMIKVRLASPQEAAGLLDASAYASLVNS